MGGRTNALRRGLKNNLESQMPCISNPLELKEASMPRL